MELEETKARNDCAGEGQQQFNRPTDQSLKGLFDFGELDAGS
jgi:hypothetical protein